MAHLNDAELLRLTDHEGSAEARAHLAGCWQCLARQGTLQRALAEVIDARAAMLDPRIESAPAERLRARIHALPTAPPRRNYRPAIALIAAAALMGLWWLNGIGDRPPMPNARLTPGATLALSREQVCAVPDEDEVRMVPASLAGQVFSNYGIRPTPRSYEVDYLIGPELGGATDVRNLWPQPYAGGVWNAHVKDALENHLRHLVCEGRVDLPTAQSEIATDWVAAYRKYFQTQKPLAAHAHYLKDHPWE